MTAQFKSEVQLFSPDMPLPSPSIFTKEHDFSWINIDQEAEYLELWAQYNAAKDLGLTVVQDTCLSRIKALEIPNKVKYPYWTAEELKIWRTFLPTTYTDNERLFKAHQAKQATAESDARRKNKKNFTFTQTIFPLSSYKFDLPPVTVMERWKELKENKTFDFFEIWTIEKPQTREFEVRATDPVLLGYREGVGPFCIARWGEALQDFETIKALVLAQQQAEERTKFWRW